MKGCASTEGVAVIWRVLQSLANMIPVLASFVRDLLWEELSVKEIKTNYLFGKANAFDRAHFLEKAADVYEELLTKDANSIPAYLNLGGLYYRADLYEMAIPCYEKVIQLNPKHYHAHYWLARCYCKLERYYAAINTLEDVIEFLPTFKDALNLIGECYECIGEGARAEHYFLKAIRTEPGGIIIHGSLLDTSGSDRRRDERLKH
jgi:tetratricopeptide (TPR) repeat protein